MSGHELDENCGFSDPNFYLLQESKAQIEMLERQVHSLREEILGKLKEQIRLAESHRSRLKAERKTLNKALKKLEQENNTSIIAQSDFMEIAKPLAALEGKIVELDAHCASLKLCQQQMRREKRADPKEKKLAKSS